MNELDEMIRIAVAGCAVVNRHYAGAIHVDYKQGDDPVTAADRETNELLCRELQRAFPGVPIVAEESDASTFDARKNAPECFFVDPIDGTRELVARNGEFAVMLGLARGERAALGVVAKPVSGLVYAGGPGAPSFVIDGGTRRPIATSGLEDRTRARAVVSRSRATPESHAALARMGVARVEKLGSAGLKAIAIACGDADVWIQCGEAGLLWDACGPEAIALGAGARYGVSGGKPPDYSSGALEVRDLVVAASDALFDAALASMQ